MDGETARFADDLQQNIEAGDGFSRMFRKAVDAYVERNGIAAPSRRARSSTAKRGRTIRRQCIVRRSTLRAENVATVVWATGFSYDFSWIDFPVCDETGYPVTDRGATSVPGLYFMGLNWMVTRKSGLLYGVGDDARDVAAGIGNYLESLN